MRGGRTRRAVSSIATAPRLLGRTGRVHHAVEPSGDIGPPCPDTVSEARRCPTASDISRLPFPRHGEELTQGSLTVRAPAQAGGAGSSPAPVTSPTAMVLEMVAKLSPEVRMLALGLMPKAQTDVEPRLEE